ncbi:hypothetical protein SAMN02910323_1972 [Selenomonas ruminantium]|uniref:Uncharacterized protein n=1 Tax=Selenomonas ruminantium TaxID=971 RepID=A0A1K1PFU0_SELRU|nr:hypothetical protein SAMN02910323_1972 [Selenomonas ruminantium]
MSDFQVGFYTLPNGDKPAKEFVLGLDKKMRTKILSRVKSNVPKDTAKTIWKGRKQNERISRIS